MERLTERETLGDFWLRDKEGKPYKLLSKGMIFYNETLKLAEYEDLEEQGLLVKLPCKVGDEVWYIDKYYGDKNEIVRGVVDGYLWYRTCGFALDVVWDRPIMGHFSYKRKEMPFTEINKTTFLTRKQAEQALKDMEGMK